MNSIMNVAKRVKSATGLKSGPKSDTIEFVCAEEDYGVIPEPIPSNKVMPEWYRNLKPKIGNGGLRDSTVRSCAPFLDALSMGWIIPLAGEVEFTVNGDGTRAQTEQNFRKDLISGHSPDQIGADSHPMMPLPVMKFHNFWAMKVPEDYSILFTSPLNRFEPRFQTFSGVVDCDSYFNFVNFPFIWTQKDFFGVLEEGTPLVQAIPFKRDTMISDGSVRSMNEDEEMELQKMTSRLDVKESTYREDLWQMKRGTRMVKNEDESEKSSGCPFHK